MEQSQSAEVSVTSKIRSKSCLTFLTLPTEICLKIYGQQFEAAVVLVKTKLFSISGRYEDPNQDHR